ncbi:hypothetical protein MHYP_G00293690 [Metynnis hypsauchen]
MKETARRWRWRSTCFTLGYALLLRTSDCLYAGRDVCVRTSRFNIITPSKRPGYDKRFTLDCSPAQINTFTLIIHLPLTALEQRAQQKHGFCFLSVGEMEMEGVEEEETTQQNTEFTDRERQESTEQSKLRKPS